MVLGKKANYQHVVEVKGLMCGHCEANISEAFRAVSDVVQVRASFADGQVVVRSNRILDADEVKAVVEKAGYQFVDLHTEA